MVRREKWGRRVRLRQDYALAAGERRFEFLIGSVGELLRNSQDLWIGVSRDLLVTTL